MLRVLLPLLLLLGRGWGDEVDEDEPAEDCSARPADELVVPVVDMGRYREGGDNAELAAAVRAALQTSGFFKISNLTTLDTTSLQGAARWFFSQHPRDKMLCARRKWAPHNSNRYRGYFPLLPQFQGKGSFKEGLDFGRSGEVFPHPQGCGELCEPNVYPPGNSTFRAAVDAYYEGVWDVAKRVLQLLPGELVSAFDPGTLSTLRLLHSPPSSLTDGVPRVVTPPHVDSGFLTLLATFAPGLQVYHEGQWWDVPPSIVPGEPPAMVVNIGLALERMAGTGLRATKHRVVHRTGHRLSVPFFVEPRYTTAIPFGTAGTELLPYGQWLNNARKRFTEDSDVELGMCFHNATTGALACYASVGEYTATEGSLGG